MNDPLRIEQPGGFRNAIYAMIGSMFIFGVTIVWYGGQLKATIEARLTTLEQQQTLSHTVIDKLNDAREENRVHGTKVDGQLDDMNGKLSVILEMIQQPAEVPAGGIPNAGSGNFQHPPSRGR